MSRRNFARPGLFALAFATVSTAAFAQQTGGSPADTPQASPQTGQTLPGDTARDRDSDRDRRDEGREWRDMRRGWSDDDRWERRERPAMREGRRGWDDGPRWRDREDGPRRGWRPEGGREPRDFGMRRGPRMMRGFCGQGGTWIGQILIERLERVTQPTEAQRPVFDKLKDSVARAGEAMNPACPTGASPITPPGRLAAAEKRYEAILAAIRIVRPVLDEYYGGLSEEQKARLYASRPGARWGGMERRRDRDRDGGAERSDRDRRGWRDDEHPRREGMDRRDDRDGPRWRRGMERDGRYGRDDGYTDGWPDRLPGRT